LLAALASGAMLATAHAFQRFGGLQPCPLCLDQRNWHWGVVGAALALYVLTRLQSRWLRLAAVLIGLVLIGSFAQAAYHVAVEQHWVTATCDTRINLNDLAFDPTGAVHAPKCDEIAWQFAGISMAGYNAIVSLLLALASFAIAFLPERKA